MTLKQTAWVKNSREATGQDQLGLRFFSETIYQDLLPSITNVTSRGRYYSFYPWFIWSVEKRADKLKSFSLQKLFRRADCLLTLIGLYHQHKTETAGQNSHDGLVGAKKLGVVLKEALENGETIQLSKYAVEEESSDRYFKNKFGGLGQYYFGPLRDAGILAYNQNGEINYTQDRGQIIAGAFDESVTGEDFFKVLKNDFVSENDLESLSDFCPCRLSEHPAEQKSLIDFFFSRQEIFQQPFWENRRESLKLILDFIQKSNAYNLKISLDSAGVHNFLSSSYTGAFNKYLVWEIDNKQSMEIKLFWRQYYAGELLSYAIQGLFWAGLTKLAEGDDTVSGCRDYGFWFAEKFISAASIFGDEDLSSVINKIEADLPELVDWENELHELNLTRRLEQLVKEKRLPNKQEKVVTLAVRILLTLAARWRGNRNEADFPKSFSRQQLNEYPINFSNFLHFLDNDWRDIGFKEWLAWLSCKWGVETHLMIALRKLQYESLDTFKVFPSEEGLRVTEFVGDKSIDEILSPGFTSPRLRMTLQILWDLGVVANENNFLMLTPTGEIILEELKHG